MASCSNFKALERATQTDLFPHEESVISQLQSKQQIVRLNVGGTYISTSSQTLCSIPDTFFTGLLSGRIRSMRDVSGAIFIDRDPHLFSIILNYLRTTKLPSNVTQVDLEMLRHEAEFYGLNPLVRKLETCLSLMSASSNSCGDVYFQGILRIAKEIESEPGPVSSLTACHNFIGVAYSSFIACYKLRDSTGSQLVFIDRNIPADTQIDQVCMQYSCAGPKIMLGVVHSNKKHITLSAYELNTSGAGVRQEVGQFHLFNNSPIDDIFFVGLQLVALGRQSGRVGVWQYSAQHWLDQELGQNTTITAYDRAGCNFLLLGNCAGSVYLIDMQKFPLRMSDGDLLITKIYSDPEMEKITAISCYLTRTPKANGNWIEIAYGTVNGTVRVLVQHPETVGHGPQLFQTFKVHLSAVSRIMLSEKYLISMCDEQHVRSWSLTRFRGRISTQPGSQPYSSFRVIQINDLMFHSDLKSVEYDQDYQHFDIGPHGDQDDGDKLVILEQSRRDVGRLNVLLASSGERVCRLNSVDSSVLTCFTVHECEASALGNRTRRFVLTGHDNGHVQLWDLSTAMESTGDKKQSISVAPLSPNEILSLL